MLLKNSISSSILRKNLTKSLLFKIPYLLRVNSHFFSDKTLNYSNTITKKIYKHNKVNIKGVFLTIFYLSLIWDTNSSIWVARLFFLPRSLIIMLTKNFLNLFFKSLLRFRFFLLKFPTLPNIISSFLAIKDRIKIF